MKESNGNGKPRFAIKEALGNPRILTQIFKHLGTMFILSSCRLVNKTWSKEATNFIQNNLQCLSQPADKNACEFLRFLDEFIGKTAQGKIMAEATPFNSLKIQFCSTGRSCLLGIEDLLTNYEFEFRNLERHLDLKYLEISCGEDEDDENYCAAHNPLVTLLCDKSKGLKSFKIIGSIERLEKNWSKSRPPLRFTQLELLDISEVSCRYRFETDDKIFVDQLFNYAPRLKKIIAKRPCQVALIPKEKMPLLERLPEKPNLATWKKEFQSRFLKASDECG